MEDASDSIATLLLLVWEELNKCTDPTLIDLIYKLLTA